MAPWHVGVVVTLPRHAAAEVDGLRRALGDPTRTTLAAHVTLVPPLRVDGAGLGAALALIRAAARDIDPFTITVGPTATFAPVSPTVHLSVADPGGGLRRLREAVFRPPLWRETFPFVPHVTLRPSAPLHLINAACLVGANFRLDVVVPAVTVLAERRHDGVRGWRPLADVELGGIRVVGRGGLELEFAAGTVIDPETLPLLSGVEDGPWGVVITARREGAVAGVAWGGGAGDPDLVVRADVRGQGIGRHLLNEWRFRRDRAAAHAPPGPTAG